MEPESLKTTWKQRVFIIIIAVLLLGSTIAAYAIIVLSSDSSSSSTSDDELTALQEKYTEVSDEMDEYAAELSEKYFDDFSEYTSRVKSFNATTANDEGLETKDLKKGSGRELEDGDTDYFAYYIGWCPDEEIFDSSLNDTDDPSSLNTPIYAGMGLIEGWNQGVIGMKIGGIREITIPNELAYGEDQQVCESTDPLKFIVMTIEDEKLSEYQDQLDEIENEYYAAYYGSSTDDVEVTTDEEE